MDLLKAYHPKMKKLSWIFLVNGIKSISTILKFQMTGVLGCQLIMLGLIQELKFIIMMDTYILEVVTKEKAVEK